ncbi:MAG: MFS transporter [Micromonosporaceae bacterium]|jgi:NNP family nitrate/nitrite transporter-like MFS transporter
MTGRASTPAAPGAVRMLVLATTGFALNFWAWALISPLAPGIREELGLSVVQQSVLVALPVLVGSVGRIPVGALTDRYGGRVMFPLISLATAVPVLALTVADSYPALLVTGFVLGVGGTAFAVGMPLLAGWYPPERRGFAFGIYGAGMGGTAVATFTTVPLADALGADAPFLIVAAALVGYAAVAWLLLRDGPDRKVGGNPLRASLAAMRLATTWQLSFLYAVGFGGFVAFSVYLPAYLRIAYHLGAADAGARTAGFVLVAIAARPLGGWLSDRFHPAPVLVGAFGAVAVLAVVAAFTPPLIPLGTVAFLGMAACLGAAAGGVFAFVGKLVPTGMVGAVTGIVGAAGGLGGFFPPLVMGAVYAVDGSYAIGLMLLSDVAIAAAVFTWLRLTGRAAATAPSTAPSG